jgi:hypothetical protein
MVILSIEDMNPCEILLYLSIYCSNPNLFKIEKMVVVKFCRVQIKKTQI